MNRPDEIAALADRLEKLSKVGFGYDINDTDRSALRKSAAELRLAAASPGDEVLERLEKIRIFIADEYADPTQEDRGDWIAPKARAIYDNLCLVIASLAPAVKAGDASTTTRPNYESVLKALRWWRDNSTANSIELTRAEVIVLTDGMIDELSNADLRASGGIFPEAYAATPTSPSADVGRQSAPTGLPYGIIDPDYAAFFTDARLACWSHGYALAMHGSFTRDLDLIAMPWTEGACEAEKLIQKIEYTTKWKRLPGKECSVREHGRMVWTLTSPKFNCSRFVDFSVVPRGINSKGTSNG